VAELKNTNTEKLKKNTNMIQFGRHKAGTFTFSLQRNEYGNFNV